MLVVEATPAAMEAFVGALKLDYRRDEKPAGLLGSEDMTLVEVVVPAGARLEGRSMHSLRLQYRYGVTLLGVSRMGRQFRERVRHLEIRAGDVLLLSGHDISLVQRHKAWLAAGIFAAAIALASLGVLYLPVALAAVVAIYVVANIIPARQVYESVEWPVIVLLGSMIPIGAALESTGGTALIAGLITSLGVGQSPVLVLVLLMVITMTLSDVMNNTATAVIAAPVAVDIAARLGVNPDPFLMAVAVAASCAFLTPIGHKNNTLIMGPGGYRFGDYWRMGLPLEVLVIVVAVPMITWVWPL